MLEIPPDFKTLLVQATIIVVLWVVLGRLWFGPAMRVIRERSARSEGALEKARAIQTEAEALRARHAAAIDEARAESQKETEEVMRAADAEQRKLLGEARDEAQRVLTDARGRIAEEVATARQELRKQADHIVKEVARTVLGRSV
jgi:F-type H+-transporting ATPase subunit b